MACFYLNLLCKISVFINGFSQNKNLGGEFPSKALKNENMTLLKQ